MYLAIKSNKRQTPEDFRDIEKIAMNWVKKPNALEPDKTNGTVAETEWISTNLFWTTGI